MYFLLQTTTGYLMSTSFHIIGLHQFNSFCKNKRVIIVLLLYQIMNFKKRMVALLVLIAPYLTLGFKYFKCLD